MHRHYDRELFAERVAHIRERMPNAFIGVDCMVGVRGETEERWEDYLAFVKQLDVSQLHVFTYSERLVTEQVMEKAEEASAAADMGSTARFKNELANVLLACNFTTLVLNHVYASLQMYGDAFAIPGGKRIFFNSDAIMLASSAAKDKDKEGNILGKIITAQVKKGRAAKEFVKTKYLILHNGGVSPYYGLLDEAVECGEVYKPKPGYYSRTNFDVDKTTGEPTKMWKEDELYNKDFWIPIYQTENFRHFVEAKFAFEDQELISSSENVLAMINSPSQTTTANEE